MDVSSSEENSPTVPPEIPVPTGPESVPGERKPRLSRDACAAIGLGVGYLLFFWLSVHIPFGSIAVVYTTTFLALVLTLAFTVFAARAIRTVPALLLNTVLSGLLALPLVFVRLYVSGLPRNAAPPAFLASPLMQFYGNTVLGTPGLHGLAMVWLAVCAGVLVSRAVREFKILLPAAVALACVDVYVVFGGGLVTQAQSGKSPTAAAAMTALTVSLPRPKVENAGAAPIQLAVGFADYLFIALFFACFVRFGVPSRKTFLALCAVLVGYMTVVAIGNIALPALVPIAVVVIGMNLRRFHYEREEKQALLVAGILVAVILGGLIFFSRPGKKIAPGAISLPERSGTSGGFR